MIRQRSDSGTFPIRLEWVIDLAKLMVVGGIDTVEIMRLSSPIIRYFLCSQLGRKSWVVHMTYMGEKGDACKVLVEET